MTQVQMLFALLRSELQGAAVADDVKNNCTSEMLEQVYALAAGHDLAHIVSQAISKLDLPKSEPFSKCQDMERQAVFRYVRFSTEYERICAHLEREAIPFIPMKGIVLWDYYRNPWMRTSCDIDILVKKEDLHRAIASFREKLQFSGGDEISEHDVPLISPCGVKLELHYDTVPESYAINDSRKVLSQVWEDAVPACTGGYQYCMSGEMFYFYHIAHMAKHIRNGGCGIRPFMDLWVLKHRPAHNEAACRQLLSQGGLLRFAEASEKLCEAWFSGADMDAITRRFAVYVLRGGTYGVWQNGMAVQQSKRGGKLGYALYRIFLPYHTMRVYYPILQKHKWLLPIFHVVRWFKILLLGGIKRSVRELQRNASVTRMDEEFVGELIQYLDLK